MRAIKTIHVTKEVGRLLHLDHFPNMGPNPCISGCKKHFYGVNATCVYCAGYLYHVDLPTYEAAKTLTRSY